MWAVLLALLPLILTRSEAVSIPLTLHPPAPCGQCVCVQPGPKVDCSSRSLTSVPSSGLPSTATSLTLHDNAISFLPTRAFVIFSTALETLDLSENNISNIDNNAFEGLGGLKRLNLSSNLLTLAGDLERPFAHLPFLSHLDLSQNWLFNASPSVFMDLNHSLRVLNLSSNHIKYRQEENWPTRFLMNLTDLDLSRNSITSVSRTMFNTGLVSLDLSHNAIPLNDDGFPADCFGNIVLLRKLNLKGNCNTSNSFGDFRYPDKALSKLTNLHSLLIDGIPGQSFGGGFKNLTNLKHLTVSGKWSRFCFVNTLTNNTFNNITRSLLTLDLSLCNISRVEPNTFAPFQNSLRRLDLSYNSALGFDRLGEAVYGLQGSVLKELYIDSIVYPYAMCVVITEHNTRYFWNTSLEVIYARNNQIEMFCEGALNNMPDSLSHAYLYGNHLGFGLYLKDLRNLVGLTYVEADGREWARYIPQYFPKEDHTLCRLPYHDESLCTEDRHPMDKYWTYTTAADVEPAIRDSEFETLFQGFSYSKLVHVLPPNLRTFASRWNQLSFRFEDIHFEPKNSLTSLQIEGNLLSIWTGPVTGLEKLEELVLSNNRAFVFNATFFEGFPRLKKLNVSRNSLHNFVSEDKDGSLFAPLSKLEELDLSRNELKVIPRQHRLAGLRFCSPTFLLIILLINVTVSVCVLPSSAS